MAPLDRRYAGLAKTFLALLTALLALPVLAQGKFDPRELVQLLSAGEHDAAYHAARQHRPRYEGDPVFDLYYGVAALETDHLGEAVFALERVVMQRPSLLRARLELARAHYYRDEHQAALEHLDFILDREPSASIRASAEQYRRAIRNRRAPRRSTTSGYIELGTGYDSNVTSATEAGTVDSLYGPLEVSETRGADLFARLGAGLDVRHRLSPSAALLAHSALELRPLAKRSDYRTSDLDQRIGVETHGNRTRTRVTGHLHWSYAGGGLRRKELGVRTDHAYHLSPRTVAAAGTRLARLRYPDDPVRDSTVAILSGRFTKAWQSGNRPTTWVSVFAGEEWPRRGGHSAAAVADRWIWGGSAAIRFTWSREWQVHGGMYYRRSRYERRPEVFDRKRDERYVAVHLRLEREVGDWRIGPQLLYASNDANLEPYGYRRTIVEMGARYSFR